jgi:hypothetical protein
VPDAKGLLLNLGGTVANFGGSATQVMLATQFRATVGQKQTRKQEDQQ